LDNTPDGDLSGIDDADLAEAAEWQGDPKKFVDSLVEAGFIDENSRKLHDWGDYSGKMLERRIRNKERQNEFRMKHRNSYVTVTSPLRNGARVDKNRVYNTSSNIYIDAARERENNDQEKTAGAAGVDEKTGEVFRAYENNVGMLTPIVSGQITGAIAEYTDGWVMDAITEAANHNVRNWRYIQSILERWKREGRKTGKKLVAAESGKINIWPE